MRYRLRTLLIVLAIGPAVLAGLVMPQVFQRLAPKPMPVAAPVKPLSPGGPFVVIDEELQELDRQVAVARSKELGAPQPKPLPDGYGELN